MTPTTHSADRSQQWLDRYVLPGGWVLPEHRLVWEELARPAVGDQGVRLPRQRAVSATPVHGAQEPVVSDVIPVTPEPVAHLAPGQPDTSVAVEQPHQQAAQWIIPPIGDSPAHPVVRHLAGDADAITAPLPAVRSSLSALAEQVLPLAVQESFPPAPGAEPRLAVVAGIRGTTDVADRSGTVDGEHTEHGSVARQWRRPALVAAAAAVLAAVSAAAPTFGDEAKTVTVTADGQSRSVAVRGTTVQDALTAAGLTVSARDIVAPGLTAEVVDGSAIMVRHSRLVTLEVDGNVRTWWTTAPTVDQALLEMGVRPSDYQLSADRSRAIGANGARIVGVPLHWVTIADGTAGPRRVRLAAETVAQVLGAANLKLGKYDTVSPAVGSRIREGQRVTITRIQISTRTQDSVLPQPAAITQQDASLGKGNTVVEQQGSTGVLRTEIRRTVTNGVPVDKVTGDSVVKKPTAKIVKVGIKETGLPESWSVPWDKMAFCESTDRWNVDTGNGTYGGLQFKTPTWLEYGGGEFAPRADLATKEQQIIIAERLYAKEELAPWHCARLLGWGFGKYTG